MQRIVFKLWVCMFAFGGLGAHGATYYVSVSGSDANPGTLSQPWRNIAKGSSVAAPGDTVLVQPGIYDELVYFKRNGTPGNPITFRADGAVTNRGNFAVQAGYNVIDGFEFDDTGTNAFYGPLWFCSGGITNVWVVNNKFHDIKNIYPQAVIDFQSGSGFTNVWTGIVISNNSLWNFPAIGITLRGQTNICCNNWLSNSMGSDAFNVFGHDHVVRGNRCYEINSKYGDTEHPDFIQTFGPLTGSPDGFTQPLPNLESYNILVEQNLVWNTDPTDGSLAGAVCQLEANNGTNASTIHDWTFRNNVFIGIGLGGSVDIPSCHWFNNTFYRCMYSGGNIMNYGFFDPNSVDPRGLAYGGQITNNAFIECCPSNTTAGWYGAATQPYTSAPLTTNYAGSYVAGAQPGGAVYDVKMNNDAGPYLCSLNCGWSNLTGNGTIVISYSNIADLYTIGTYGSNNIHVISNADIAMTTVSGYTPAQQVAFWGAGQIEVRIDTATNPNGEIRCRPTYHTVWAGLPSPIDLFTNSDYNFVCGTGGSAKTAGSTWGGKGQEFYEPHGVNGGNPGLVSPANADFHLVTNSVLIARGGVIPSVTSDYAGLSRTPPYDIGAYAYVGSASTNTPPSITGQPQSVAVTTGQSAQFAVTVSGSSPLSYQWQFGGGVLAGATASSYSIASAQPGNAGNYSVQVTNNYGSVTSSVVVLTVTTNSTTPSVPTNLAVTFTSASQVNIAWTASTDNAGVTGYQIFRNGTQVATSTGSSYSDTGLSPATTYIYTVAAFDAAGNVSGQSSPATATTQASSDAPTISFFSASPTTIASGGFSTLSWSVSGNPIPSLSIAPGIGTLTGSSIVVSPTVTTTYTLTASNSAGSASAQVVLAVNVGTSSLVAAYSFDEGSGTTVADASGYGNSGTITGATWTAAGRFGNALSFNGTNSLVIVNDSASLDLTTGLTLEAWVNPTSLGTTWVNVMLKGNPDLVLSYALFGATPPTQVPSLSISPASTKLLAPSALPLNTWSHLTGTYDGTTMKFYVNGILVASQAQSGAIGTSTDLLTIGGNVFYGRYWMGLIDEVRIYNRALSATEILTDMNTPVGGATNTRPDPPTGLRILSAGP